jgi:hypothetical protein
MAVPGVPIHVSAKAARSPSPGRRSWGRILWLEVLAQRRPHHVEALLADHVHLHRPLDLGHELIDVAFLVPGQFRLYRVGDSERVTGQGWQAG